jgi:phenylacetate-CoA ligase
MLAIPREECVRLHASSGTTGRPTVVGYSAKDIETWSALMARSTFAAALGAPRDRQAAARLKPEVQS